MNEMSLQFPQIRNINDYIREVMKFPILSHEQEIELAKKFKNENDTKAAHALVLSHLKVVVSVSRDYKGYGLPQEDLIQEGNIGLMHAVKRFDPDRGIRLYSYAIKWIKAMMHEFIIRNWRIVKMATTKAQRKLFFNLRSMRKDLHALKSDEVTHIANELNVPEKDVREMEVRFNNHDAMIDPFIDDDEFNPLQHISIDSSHEPQNMIEMNQLETIQNEGLFDALEKLDARSQYIIKARWLSEEPQTLQDLAEKFDISLQRVAQVEKQALKKIKESLEILLNKNIS